MIYNLNHLDHLFIKFKRMRLGVFNDLERKKVKEDLKSHNLEMIKAQIELEKKLSTKDGKSEQ